MTLANCTLVLTASGADGSATASGTFGAYLKGKVHAIYVNHSAGQAVTTDLSIKFGDLTILTVANSATDAAFYPRVLVCATDGSAYTAEFVDYFYVDGYPTATLAQADDTETTTLTIYVIED